MTFKELLKLILFPECIQLQSENDILKEQVNTLRNSLDEFIQIPKQTSIKRIYKDGLKKAIVDTFGNKGLYVFDQSDLDYKLVDKEYFKSFLENNTVNHLKYIPTKFDCDDFSDVLMGDVNRWDGDLCFGTIWVNTTAGSHALNVFIDTEEKVWLCEPQSDKIFTMPDDWSIGTHFKI